MARKYKKFRLDEISLVDRPAQPDAKITIVKREGGEKIELSADERIEKGLAMTSSDEMHTAHLIDVREGGGTGGHTSWESDPGSDEMHRHAWTRLEDGSIEIGMAEGHAHGVLPGQIAKSAGDGDDNEGDDMSQPTDKVAKSETDKQVQALEATNETLQKRLDRQDKILALTGPETEFFECTHVYFS